MLYFILTLIALSTGVCWWERNKRAVRRRAALATYNGDSTTGDHHEEHARHGHDLEELREQPAMVDVQR